MNRYKIQTKSAIIQLAMSTDNQQITSQQQPNVADEQRATSNVDQNTVQALTQLMSELQSVDTKSPDAEQNATSIVDNQGNRIDLNEELKKPSNIRK